MNTAHIAMILQLVMSGIELDVLILLCAFLCLCSQCVVVGLPLLLIDGRMQSLGVRGVILLSM